MIRYAIFSAACAAAFSGSARNFVRNGDFTGAPADLASVCGAESGRVSLHTEDRTWNKCGKCEVTRSYPDGQYKGCIIHSATAVIGIDAKRRGFPVRAGDRYDVSFDLRACGEPTRVLCDVVCWKGDDYWRDRVSVKNVVQGGLKAESEWKTVRGSFRVPEGMKTAALRLWITSSSRWKSQRQHKIGDAFLFDNVKITRSARNIDIGGDAADGDIPVTLRKTIALGESFGDFVSFKDGTTPSAVKTGVTVFKDADALRFEVDAGPPGARIISDPRKVWNGDAVEIVLERSGGGCTHVAFNTAGAKYTNAGAGSGNGDWSVTVETNGASWQASVRLPFAFLGVKGDERSIGFNVGRARYKVRAFDTWTVGSGFHDPSGFGRLLFVPYADELKHRFGKDIPAADRAEFDKAWAEGERAAFREKMARFRSSKFSFAPVPVLSDWSLPYLPPEVFDPPSEICITSVVNEVLAFPFAVANFSRRTEDYRVVIETAENEFIGSWGLAGFPPELVTARKGVRVKDVNVEEPSLRFDPLPKMDEAGVLTVPPREAGLVWYDFDCTGVRPGTYRGRLRIIPMCEPGSFKKRKYTGKMQTVPFSLTVLDAEIPVRPAAPSGFFLGVESQAAFDTAFQFGTEHYQVHTYSIQYERDKDGNLDLERPRKRCILEREKIENHVAWASKYGFRPKFHVIYTAMEACRGLYCGKSEEKFLRIWPQYVRGVKRLLNSAGVPDADYFIEIRDEPNDSHMDALFKAHKLAKEACPTVRLAMLLAAWKPSVAKMREFMPYADVWILWRNGYWAPGPYRDFAAELRSAGKEVYHYSCDTSMRVPLLQYYRHHPWFAERHGLAGSYMYQLTDHMAGGSFGSTDFKTLTTGGLFYRSFGRPVPSLRSMAIREGVTDCKFLAALRAKQTKKPDPETARLLESAAADIIDRHPNDPMAPVKFREKARMLLARPSLSNRKDTM